jgi:hypothetical protein
VELCPSCAFTMDSIAIANERRGNGAAVDIFVGAQGGAQLAGGSGRQQGQLQHQYQRQQYKQRSQRTEHLLFSTRACPAAVAHVACILAAVSASPRSPC